MLCPAPTAFFKKDAFKSEMQSLLWNTEEKNRLGWNKCGKMLMVVETG